MAVACRALAEPLLSAALAEPLLSARRPMRQCRTRQPTAACSVSLLASCAYALLSKKRSTRKIRSRGRFEFAFSLGSQQREEVPIGARANDDEMQRLSDNRVQKAQREKKCYRSCDLASEVR